MCLLLTKPAGVTIPKRYLKNSFANNSHGAGFVYAKDNQLFMQKGFTSFRDFWKNYREHMKHPAIVHFRWASVGSKVPNNCHPFFVDTDLAFAHNGTLKTLKTEGDNSDTRQFNYDVLRVLRSQDNNFLQKYHYRFLLEGSIGSSKMAFITKEGKITILNKNLGEDHENVWYSNKDYSKKAVARTTTVVGSHVTVSRNGIVTPRVDRALPHHYLDQDGWYQ